MLDSDRDRPRSSTSRQAVHLSPCLLALLASAALAALASAEAPGAAAGTVAALVRAGSISGRVVPPPGGHPALQLFLEDVMTSRVVLVPLEPGQLSYAAEVPAGSYHAYTWLPGFELMGGHTACHEDAPCSDHALLSIPIEEGSSVEGADIADWHVPELPLLTLSGRLVDGTGADPIEDGVVVIWDQHIMAVGPASELAVLPDARHYPLPGTTILPGFINTHVHNAYAVANLRTWASAGVTTVRDLGAPLGFPWAQLRAFLGTDPRNARILAAGHLVTCPGGYPIAGNDFPSVTVSTEDEARQEINELLDQGADVVKIVIESGIGELLSEELAAVIVDTAHARGVPVTVHLTMESDLETALDAGVDDIAHIALDYVPGDVIERMVEDDVAWVPTLEALEGWGSQMFDNLRRFKAAGGRVAMGNDSGYLEDLTIGMPVEELELLGDSGMSPMAIIVAATGDAAVVCHRQDLIGTLAPGRLADILVVDGDPLVDLRALEAARMVIHEGQVIRFEPPPPRRPQGRPVRP